MANEQGELFEKDPAPWELDAAVDAVVARVVFPEQPRGEFDYLVPPELRGRLQSGARVRVPLGRGNRKVVGYCVAVENRSLPSARLKSVESIIDEPPLISTEILELTRWMAEYYLCDLGPALEAVVPAGVRGHAGTRLVTFLHVPTAVAARLSNLQLPPKQTAVLQYLSAATQPVSLADLCHAVNCTSSPVKRLVEKQLVLAEMRRVYQGDPESAPLPATSPWPLNVDQQRALDTILQSLNSRRHETILLHGVTGSGKTEVYIQAIEEVIRFGRQAIVLVPEISLTPQTRQRFRSRFERVAVLHSHLSPTERHGEWMRIARGEVHVVVGARSAVFAPVPQLGLIVIDEEHEPSFKQDSAPRYHAREVAARRAGAAHVPLLLGSATPALESWHAAQTGRFRLVEMPSRVLNLPLPSVATIDLRDEYVSGVPSPGALSRKLVQAMKAALDDDGQVILLLNRRGFSTHIQCPACGLVVRCSHCDIALTHHRSGERVICHYCNYQAATPAACPDCGFAGIRFGGRGTQKLEAEVRARFPHVSCLRMDTDSMRGHGAHEVALDRFRRGEIRILLGTQMIAKGLDFPNVTFVGVINADTGLHLPDFRAGERTFQLVTQVAGRTGRGSKGGCVMVQSFNPDDRAIQAAVRHDYAAFAAAELPDRKAFLYPPFASVFRLVFRGPSAATTEAFATEVSELIGKRLQNQHVSARMLGPVAAPIAKLRGKFRYHLLLQSADRQGTCVVVRDVTDDLKAPAGVQWIVDADALSML